MSNENNNRRQVTKRRKFLQNIGAVGITGPLAQDFPLSVRKKRVVTARGGINKKIRQKKKVPKKWHRHQQAIRGVLRKLNKKYGMSGKPADDVDKDVADAIVYSAQTTADMSVGYHTYLTPTLEVKQGTPQSIIDKVPRSLSEAPVQVPSEVQTDTIVVKEREGESKKVDCEGQTTEDPYPGGLYIKKDGTYSNGTSGYRVHDSDGNLYMMTVNHIFTGDCSLGSGNAATWDGSIIGGFHDGHKNHDWAVIKLDSDQGVELLDNTIWKSSTSSVTVRGYKTQSGVEDLISTGETILKQGVTTGTETGQVTQMGITQLDCVRYDGDGVKVEADGANGDSGGPVWDEEGDDAYLITQVSERYDDYDTVTCSSTYDVGRYIFGYATYKISNSNDYTPG